MIVTIKNGRAELRNDSGSLIGTVGSSGVVSADCTDDYMLLVYDSGKAELRCVPSRTLVRTITPRNAVSGNINKSELVLRLSNGKSEVRRVPSCTLSRTS